MLFEPVHLGNLDVTHDTSESADDIKHKFRWCGCSGRQPDVFLVRKPGGIELRAIADQIARNAFLDTDFLQTIGIRAILGSDDENEIDNFTKVANRGLAILRRIADI